MATVMITCPVMERPVSTGITVETGSLIGAAELFVPLLCALCGQLHFWCMKEARLDDDDTRDRQRASAPRPGLLG
jgi:hypothetical protein